MATLKGGQRWKPKKKMGGWVGLSEEQCSYFTSGINSLLQKDLSAIQFGTAATDKKLLLSSLLQ